MTRRRSSARASQILAEVINDPAQGDALPQRRVAACALALPVTGAGLSVMTDRGPGAMLAASDGPEAVLEDLEFTLGEGPCVDSARTDRPVLDADLEGSGRGRWPRFASGALDAGAGPCSRSPSTSAVSGSGSSTSTATPPGGLSESVIDDAESHADAAAMLLLHLHAEAPLNDGGSGWAGAIENRSEVHQATGMISVQSGVTLTDALLLLSARAFAAERPLDTVARDVVDRILRFPAGGDET